MIKNDRQYRITRAQIERLNDGLTELERSSPKERGVHLALFEAEKAALRSQLADLHAETEEYEALRSGKLPSPVLASFEDLPRALIRARIARGLTQKQLAERLGVKEQQIQRYEATDYASASLSRMREVIKVLGVTPWEENLPARPVSVTELLRRLKRTGIDRRFILTRLIPRPLAARVEAEEEGAQSETLCYQVAAYLGRIFGWTPDEVMSRERLDLNLASVGPVQFKTRSGVDRQRLSAYVVYAHYLALLVRQGVKTVEQRTIPTDPYALRSSVISSYGTFTLEHLLRHVWDLGIPILPLNDPAAFHGACFREGGFNIIVVKQKTLSQSRWMFDVVHELWHTTQEPRRQHRTVIEDDDMAPSRLSSDEERIASLFAGAALLGTAPQPLAELCLREANRDLRLLKAAVQRVAVREKVPVSALANYMAFRLSLEGSNWWGAASNLQENDVNPWGIARDVLFERLDLSKLTEPDCQLLQMALFDDSESGAGNG